MKKIPAIILFVMLTWCPVFALEAGTWNIEPSPGLDGGMFGSTLAIGVDVHYFITSRLSAGPTLGWYSMVRDIDGEDYQMSYLPVYGGVRYYVFDDLTKRGTFFAGLGAFYAPYLYSRAKEERHEHLEYKNQYGISGQLGYRTGENFSKQFYLDLFLQYDYNMTKYAVYKEEIAPGVYDTTNYYLSIIWVRIGFGFPIEF